VICFAIGELGIHKLDDVYDMTYAEFQIRFFAYNSVQKKEWEKVRFMAYHALVAPYQDYKKLPKSLEKFLPLGSSKASKGVTEEVKERFLEEYRNYLTQTQA
jgi:hypothetical protein